MNREEFLKQLELLLSGISEEERQDAMAFYRSYFDEAEGSEQDVIAELGSPQKAAESILKNLGIEGNGSYYNSFANRDAEYYRNMRNTVNNVSGGKKKNSSWTALTIVLLILTSPIWLVVLMVLASILLAVVAVIFAVAVSVVAVMAALIITAFVLMGTGFSIAFTGSVPVGCGLVGGGLLVLALGVLAVVLVVWVFGVFLPWALKGIWKLCKMPFENRKGNV